MSEFQECGACRSNPGAATLCATCLNNRNTIDKLEAKVREMDERGPQALLPKYKAVKADLQKIQEVVRATERDIEAQYEEKTLNFYQKRAWRTAPMRFNDLQNEIDPCCKKGENMLTAVLQLVTFGLGIAGEAGEVADLIKKHVGHGHPLDRAKLTKELGDVLWYVAAIASTCGLTLQDVADANHAKLAARYKEGFTSEESINRKPE